MSDTMIMLLTLTTEKHEFLLNSGITDIEYEGKIYNSCLFDIDMGTEKSFRPYDFVEKKKDQRPISIRFTEHFARMLAKYRILVPTIKAVKIELVSVSGNKVVESFAAIDDFYDIILTINPNVPEARIEMRSHTYDQEKNRA